MKILAHNQNISILQEKFQRYNDLDVVLVERGLDFQGVAYVFDMQHLEEVEAYLQSLETSALVIYGKKNQRIYKIDVYKIVYIEGFSKEAYIHTMDEQYEIKEKLYELED